MFWSKDMIEWTAFYKYLIINVLFDNNEI
jgi:hypothetical protein